MVRHRTRHAGALMLVILSGFLAAACSGGGAGGSAPAAGTPGRAGGATTHSRPIAQPLGEVGSALDVSVPEVGPRVIKTAAISVEVRVDSFDQQFQQAAQIAARHGGFVASSQTSQGRRERGTVVLRVPADQFEAALGELKGLGAVAEERISGQDVTARFVDLQARLRNWEAQESVLLGLMAKASTIEESIKVQRALQEVQLAVEELRGQLQVLEDQTDYATITATIAEVGATEPKPEGTLGRAWESGRDGFVSVIAAVIVGAGYLAPFALAGLAAALVWRGMRRGRARPAPTI